MWTDIIAHMALIEGCHHVICHHVQLADDHHRNHVQLPDDHHYNHHLDDFI